MITANNMIPVGFDATESHFEIALMAALAKATAKYNTSVTLTPNTYSKAPIVISDAVLAAGCSVTEVCAVPSVLKNTRIQMNDACKVCLTDLSEGEAVVYGIDKNNPAPTAELDKQKAQEQAVKLTYSMLKTYWLGDTTYIAADLNNVALLPAYTKDNGQWKKILASSPAHVTITENAQVTTALQMSTLTYDDVLLYIDAMLAAQSTSMQMVMNSEKTIWMTVEMFDKVQLQRAKNELAGIRFVTIENEFGNFDSFIYNDVQVIKYEHFSAAIRDMASAVPAALELPHRAVLTVGLPTLSFPVPTESTFTTDFEPVKYAYEAGTLATILHPEAVAGDYYVVAY
jgi:enamine deaminase RidA (YjgF/YER057c/UK114 family)